jgi:hypothetical protein
LIVALLASLARGDELTVPAVVSTIRFHPTGEPAAAGFLFLSRDGPAGWAALASLTLELAEPHPAAARRAAEALAEGPERERLATAAATYTRSSDAEVRALLATGLAYGYADHEPLLLRHLRENRPGAAQVLRILAPEILPETELRALLALPPLAPIAYDALRGRGLTVHASELVPWAKEIGRACLDPVLCAGWADRPPDFLVLEAVANAVREGDEDAREGAHCLLLTVSGRKVLPDADLWRSWIAAQRDRYERPPDASEGRIAAAVLRGARILRQDLLDDGRSLWSAGREAEAAIGATALSVLALRAAGYPGSHPAIEKALRSTLLVFGKGGPPALPGLEDRERETYCLSLLAMALAELDPDAYRVPLEALRQRIVTGMQPHGQWGYQCLAPTDTTPPGTPDNSNTQYAVLALRALARAGLAVPPETWRTIADFHARTAGRNGDWTYRTGQHHGDREVSMTSAGLSSLAICFEGLHGRDAMPRIEADPVLAKALHFLGRRLVEKRYDGEELYSFYGVERACVLNGVRAFRGERLVFDWYAEGAKRLLDLQQRAGHWGWHERRRMVGASYGPAVDTAYAILFLTKATATIAGGPAGEVRIPLPPELDRVPPPPPPRVAPPPPPPEPPRIRLERDALGTRDGATEIAGVVDPADTALTVDGRPVATDARGRFRVPLWIERNRPVPVVATARNGLSARRDVPVAFDAAPPRLALLGPLQRHVGTQVLVFRADEDLRAVRVAGRIYPATGRVVRCAVEIDEGARPLAAVATDVAGNEGAASFELEAVNRVLLLDGGSAVAIDLREVPATFTVECWARGEPPASAAALVANTEGSGFGLYWQDRGRPLPHALVRAGGDYLCVPAKRAWKWSAWTHLALAYDGARLRYFVDGRLQGEAEGAPYVPSVRRLFVGAEPRGDSTPNHFFRGAIDEVRISRGARYAADFRPERTFLRDERTVLLLHFDRETLDEGVVLDDSGMHHHGVPVGAPVFAVERR